MKTIRYLALVFILFSQIQIFAQTSTTDATKRLKELQGVNGAEQQDENKN